MEIEAKLTVSLKQLIETTCQGKRVTPSWLQEKNRSLWPADSVFISDPIKKYFVENSCYLQINKTTAYVFQLINYEGYFCSRPYNVRINLHFSDVLMSNARTFIDSLLSLNDLEMFDTLEVLGRFHHPSILKFLIYFKERSLELWINIFLEIWVKCFISINKKLSGFQG